MATIKGYSEIVEEYNDKLYNGDIPSGIRLNRTFLNALSTRLNMRGEIVTLHGMPVTEDNTLTDENFIIEVV